MNDLITRSLATALPTLRDGVEKAWKQGLSSVGYLKRVSSPTLIREGPTVGPRAAESYEVGGTEWRVGSLELWRWDTLNGESSIENCSKWGTLDGNMSRSWELWR